MLLGRDLGRALTNSARELGSAIRWMILDNAKRRASILSGLELADVRRFRLGPDDAVVFRLPQETGRDAAQAIRDYVMDALPDRPVLIFIGNVDLSVIEWNGEALPPYPPEDTEHYG